MLEKIHRNIFCRKYLYCASGREGAHFCCCTKGMLGNFPLGRGVGECWRLCKEIKKGTGEVSANFKAFKTVETFR